MDRERARALIRRAFAACFGAAALFHGLAILWPAIAEPSPTWRHALFVAINAGCALGFLVRPRGFPGLFAILTAQQLWSHGTYFVQVWRSQERVDWASVVVLVVMPLGLTLLLRDARGTRSTPPSGGAR